MGEALPMAPVRRPRRQASVPAWVAVAASGLVAAACSGGGSEVSADRPSLTTAAVAAAQEGIDDIALPGQAGGAPAPAAVESVASATTAPASRTGASAVTPTTPPGTATPAGGADPAGPSSPGSVATSAPVTTTSAAPRPTIAYGPLALVQSGQSSSTFRWEQTSASPAGGSYRSVDWVVNGPDERVLVAEDGTNELIVQLGGEHWMTTASGTSQRVSEAEYLNTRRQWLAEPFATGVGAALAGTPVNGADRYDVTTSDLGVISSLLGRVAAAGASLQGSVEVDDAGRVVQWDLAVVEPAADGSAGDSATSIVGQLQAGSAVAITAP